MHSGATGMSFGIANLGSRTDWIGLILTARISKGTPWFGYCAPAMDPSLTTGATYRALLFGLLAAFFWGTHSVIVRALTVDLHGITIAVVRLYIAAAVLFLILKLGRHQVRVLQFEKSFFITVFGTAMNYIFFHWGLEYTTSSNAMMLENTAPLFVLGFLFLTGQSRTLTELLATIVVVAGVFLTVRHDLALGGARLTGDVLELLAGLTWAIFIIGSNRALSATNALSERIAFLFRVFLVSAILLSPLLALQEYSVTAVTGSDIVLLLLLGILPTAVAYVLWYEAAARVSAMTSALLFTLSIIFTFINAAIFLGEVVTSSMIVGAALIVAGVLLSKYGSKPAS